MYEVPLLPLVSGSDTLEIQSESNNGVFLGLRFSGLLFFSSLFWLLMVRTVRHTHTLRIHAPLTSFYVTYSFLVDQNH